MHVKPTTNHSVYVYLFDGSTSLFEHSVAHRLIFHPESHELL